MALPCDARLLRKNERLKNLDPSFDQSRDQGVGTAL